MTILSNKIVARHSSEDLTNAFAYIAWRQRVCKITLEVEDEKASGIWNRQTYTTMDEVMSALFDLSIRGYDIAGIDLYSGWHGRDCTLYVAMRETEDLSSNIDENVMEKIGEIEFEKEG